MNPFLSNLEDIGIFEGNTDFLGMLSEILLWNGGILNIPEGAKYSQQDAINVIAYASTSTNNSVEAAANELRRKMPDTSIPCADTVHSYIKNANSIEDILSFFRGLNSVFLELIYIQIHKNKSAHKQGVTKRYINYD